MCNGLAKYVLSRSIVLVGILVVGRTLFDRLSCRLDLFSIVSVVIWLPADCPHPVARLGRAVEKSRPQRRFRCPAELVQPSFVSIGPNNLLSFIRVLSSNFIYRNSLFR